MKHRFNLHLMGGFGNQLFQYAFARAYCKRHNLTLHTDPWLGQRIFQIDDPVTDEQLPRRDENTLRDGESEISFRSYCQQQKCIDLYSVQEVRWWFTFRPEVVSLLRSVPTPEFMAHRRVGDYPGYGYVVVSERSYRDACVKFDLPVGRLVFATEEKPTPSPEGLHQSLHFLPDFWRLMMAMVLLRGNSTFSWWAAVLGGAAVYSPVIEGHQGGTQPQDCEFVEGNWPRFANLSFVTDLHLRSK